MVLEKQLALFDLIKEALEEQGLQCLLIGAHALSHYGVTRETADLDLLVGRNALEQWKDFQDIVQLVQENDLDLDSEEIKEWFVQYGSQEWYEKIRLASQ